MANNTSNNRLLYWILAAMFTIMSALGWYSIERVDSRLSAIEAQQTIKLVEITRLQAEYSNMLGQLAELRADVKINNELLSRLLQR